MITFGVLISSLWFIFLAYWFVAAMLAKRSAGGRLLNGAMVLAVVAVAVLLLVRVWFRGHAGQHTAHVEPAGSVVLAGLGVAVCALGVGFAIWARTHLGRNWGMPMSLRKGHELVTSGPYAFVRHPIYTGILLAVLGTAIVRWSPWSTVVLVILFAYFIYAARFEERSMATQFPNEYPDYMSRTKMLLPFLI